MVDTGSNISIVRPDVLQGLGEETTVQPMRSCLKTVTRETAPLRGRCTLQLGLGTQEMAQEMWIADTQDACILGLDFLQPYGCQVNLKDGALILREEEIPLKKPSSSKARAVCCKAVLMEGVTLPPLSEMVVPMEVECPHTSILELLEQKTTGYPSDGLLVARTLVDLYQEHIPLRLMNLSTEFCKIRRGTRMAQCESVCCVLPAPVENRAGSVGATKKIEELPRHLRDLYDRSVTHLGPDEKRQVRQLLHEFPDVFSAGPHDLGCTDIVKHQIHTGDAAPIRQPPPGDSLWRRSRRRMPSSWTCRSKE